MRVDGSCHCGNIEFDADIDESTVVICHCTDCQTLSGSPFRVTVATPVEAFHLRGGKLQHYVKTSESGDKRLQAFCPLCGTPIYSSVDMNPTHLFVRLGAIRQRARLRPTAQIWRRSALSWLQDLDAIPGSSEQQALSHK